MAELYKLFANDWIHALDFSDQALLDLYNQESYGGTVSQDNGYAHGKKWLNVMVSYWVEDISTGLLLRSELYEDSQFPHWWLDKVLKKV